MTVRISPSLLLHCNDYQVYDTNTGYFPKVDIFPICAHLNSILRLTSIQKPLSHHSESIQNYYCKCNLPKTRRSVRQSVGWLVGRQVSLFVIISQMGGKLHFHASIGALVNIPGAQKSFLTDQLVKTSVNCTFSWREFRCDGRTWRACRRGCEGSARLQR